MLGLANDVSDLLEMFGQERGPEAIDEGEEASFPGWVPSWLIPELSPAVGTSEWPALLDRAPVDLRTNVARISRDNLLDQFPEAVPTPISPWGIRLSTDTRLDDHPAVAAGLVEVQDEGSQLIALACEPKNGDRIFDLCAGAGGKALALAAAAPDAQILATDSNRSRLAKLPPRAQRAKATIKTRLLNPPNELIDLEDWSASADVVLVDAPCSGSGTWRRNPEGRWRLTPDRLDRLIALQARLLDIGAKMVRPGGSLVYAVCSILSREGAGQIEDFLIRHSSWQVQETAIAAGRLQGAGRLLTPAHDRTDGFFVARLGRPC